MTFILKVSQLAAVFRRCTFFMKLTIVANAFAANAFAAELRITPDVFNLTFVPGSTQVVKGSITNITGVNLLTSDIFFSLSGYPADALTIDVLLGLDPLPLPDRRRTDTLNFFSITFSDIGAVFAPFTIEALAFDVNGNFAEPFVLNVQAQVQGVPEPSSGLLVMAGLLLVRQRFIRRSPAVC